MDHPSIMKLLEDDEDESMHSGADVEALSAALNRDIGGDSSTFAQMSDSETVGVLPQASSSASQQLLEQWQTSSQDGKISDDVQPKEQTHVQAEKPSSQAEPVPQAPIGKDQDQQNSSIPKHDQQQVLPEHSNTDQQTQIESNPSQSVEKDQAQTSDQASLQIPKQESSNQPSGSHQQNIHQQLNVDQQTAANNEATKRMKGSPSIPFQLLIPIIRPHLDKDRNMQLQSVFTKLRSNEVSKEDFLRVIRNIVGDQMLRQAVNKVQMQMQAQSARNQQPSPNQYSLQNQVSQQQLLPRGAHQYPDPRAFSSLNPMSSSQNQKGPRSPPRHTGPVSTAQMQIDASFPPVENSILKSRETENTPEGRGVHAPHLQSTSKNAVNSEREATKQSQHLLRPPTSFPMHGGGSSTFHSHPFARPPMGGGPSSLRAQPNNSQIRQPLHAQGMASSPLGSAHPSNVINVPKYELQNIANEAKRLPGGPLTSHLTSQEHSVPWQGMPNKEQRSGLPSLPSVKQEDQVTELPNKSQSTSGEVSSFGSGHIIQGNSAVASMKNDGMEKQSLRAGVSAPFNNTMGNQSALGDSTMQGSSPLVAGTITKTPPAKKPSGGQKKPLEASPNSSAPASKKQKTAGGAFHDQSIEHLNDVTAVSGVNLREEEEQLLSAPKEESRASEATRRVVQEEEERLILQKGPLQKKLADIILKSGLKKISSDVERCLSLCVEERLRGIISSLIRLSRQRVDIEKTRHRFVITSDVHHHILEVNRKAKEEWDKKQAEEAERLRKLNETEGNTGSDGDKDKDEGRSKANKGNKEEDDKMRTTAANVAARAAVGGDDMLSKWQLMAEQARQKREGQDGLSSSQAGKATSSRPTVRRNLREHQEGQKRGSSSLALARSSRKYRRSPAAMSQPKVARNITRRDVIAVLEREPQMSKSTLIYRMYEKSAGDPAVE